MGLIANVYRSPCMGDCTKNGVSSQHDTFVVENCDGPFKASPDTPALFLIRHRSIPTVVLASTQPHHVSGAMFGGNFLYTSDSRFREMCRLLTGYEWHGPVPIHDRFEVLP
jgi:hypothetical protein